MEEKLVCCVLIVLIHIATLNSKHIYFFPHVAPKDYYCLKSVTF